MARSITLKLLIGKIDKTIDLAKDGLPFHSKVRLAKKFLLWTATSPGPPVRTGKLLHSGAAWIGEKKVFDLGGFSGHARGDESDAVITISYSAPKKAGKKANVFYTFGGCRWFDYATKQHREHATNKMWIEVLLLNGAISKQIEREYTRILDTIW